MYKRTGVFLTILFFFFCLPSKQVILAEGNEIESIDIEVKIQEDGSAIISEERKMNVSEDTEIYIELSNLGQSDLTNFELEGFQEEKDWDIDASFEEKAYKYGVITKEDAYELAWGISEYGQKEYHLTYALTNLVRDLEDGQALFWNFDSFLSFPTEQVTLKIKTDFDLDEKLLDYYAFGFEGEMGINSDGVFEWSGSNLTEENDLIVLMQFPKASFQTSVQEEMTLAEQKEQALAGSSYNDSEPMPLFLKIIFILLGFGLLVLLGFALIYALRRGRIRKENQHFDPHRFMNENKDKVSKKAPELTASHEKYSWLISKLSMNSSGFSEFFFLYLLIWSEEEKIKIHNYEEKGFFGKDKKARIEILNIEDEAINSLLSFEESVELFALGEISFEEVLWGMLIELADADGKIKPRQIEDWAEENADEIEELVDLLEENSKEWLEENHYLHTFTIEDWTSAIKIEQLTEKGERMALEIFSYYQFIKKLKKVNLTEDENWASLMVWSVIFGLAEDTIEHLKELDPAQFAYLEEHYPYYYGNYYGYHYLYSRSNHGLAAGGYLGAGGAGISSVGGGMGAGGGGGGGSR